ncbi:S-layer homology domain-containing protein [Paenibacillus sp. USHLN196]|uniref:S-layer homology domain-containing protein n=1 Tax=Paenibacillus sp. USHLN196 TaxID=3081291 RepID=UPI0030176BA1
MSFLYSKKWKKGFKVSVVSMLLLSTFISSIGSERVSAASAPVPGGTGLEPVLWLKADSDADTVEGLLTDWKDQSANDVGFDLVVPAGKTAPSYSPGGINFNPSVKFNNPTGGGHYSSSVKLVGDKPIKFQSGYAVYKNNNGGALVGATTPTGTNGVIIMGGYGNNFASGNGVDGIYDYFNLVDRSRAQIVNFDIVGNNNHTARVDGVEASFSRTGVYGEINFTPVIGATNGGSATYNWGGLVADVAEIILYDSQTANDASKIESYLAIKYGITLNKGASPYLSTNESEVWTVDSKYKHNIAGIGKDEAQGLNQKQSLSINAGVPQVAVGVNTLAATNADNSSILTDQQYFVWADNGLPLTYDQSINKPGQYHAQRIWKVQNTNNVGEVEIGIPAVSVPAGYQLLVSDSEDFTEASGYELSLKDVNGVPHYTAKAALKDGEYFTFSAWAPKYTSANVSNVSVTEDEVIVTFDEELDFSNIANLTGFKLEINGQPITIDSFEPGANSKTLRLKTSQIIPSNASVIVSYDIEEGNLKGTNGAPAQSFNEHAVTKVDKSLLQAKVTEVTGEDLEESEYTPASWTVLDDAMNEAQRVLNDPTATQAQVDQALLDLTDARAGLTPTTSVPVVDKSVLQAKVIEVTGEDLEESEYTPASWETLDEAMNEAQRVLDDLTATQAQVDQALLDLTNARTGLTPTTSVPVVDKSVLQAKVIEVTGEDLEESEYTPASWETLDDAMNEADRVLKDPTVTQAQVDKALQDLTNARAGLTPTTSVPVVDKSALQAKVTEITGESLEEASYTPASWETLKDAMNEAERVLNDPTATQAQVDKALQGLTNARTGLTKVIGTDASTLQTLVPSVGSLSPAFDPAKDTYTISVPNSVYQFQLTPTALDPLAKIEIAVGDGEWNEVPSGTISENLPLQVGGNKIVVRVTDSLGNVTEYKINVTRASSDNGNNGGGSNGGGGNTGGNGGGTTTPAPVPTPTPTPAPVKDNLETTRDGSHQPFATSKPSNDKHTWVEIDPAKLNVAMSQGTGQQFAIHSPNDGDMKVDGLTLETLKQLVDQGSKLNISNPLAIYPVPGGKMDVNGVSRQLGNAALNDIDVHVDIARSSDALIDSAETRAASQGYELLVTPVDLDLTFTKDGQTVRSGQLNGYAPKYIALPEGIDPNRITTGVIINPDGSIFHVPTVVTKIDSRYYALINDLRSSGSYSVIWNPQDFEDARSHWGKTDVNNIAARLDLKGNGDNTFSPNRQVTRSEFAEIVVLGLGLMRQDGPQNLFPDISDSAWFRSAVALANEFGIVRGYDNGNFYGNQEITREQGFAMVARAYRLIEPEAVISPDQMNSELERYSDAADVSNWAKEDVAQLIAAGIIQGNGPEVLSPKTTMTRAEVTALIARMLKVTNLIDQ